MSIIACECRDAIRHSFVALSKDVIDSFGLSPLGRAVIQLDCLATGERMRVNWKGGVAEKEKSFVVAKELMPKADGGLFRVSVAQCEKRIERMRLVPISERDYVLIETHSDYFEENLLNQIQVVSNEQVIPFYFENHMEESGYESQKNYVKLKVLIDVEYGFISSDCEISIDHIKDDAFKEMKVNEGNEVVRKQLTLEFNKRKGLMRITPKFDSFNSKTTSFFSCVSLEDDSNMLIRLCDYSLIKAHCKTKGKQIEGKFPYMKSFWLSVTTHSLKDITLNDNLSLPSYTMLNTCLFPNDLVNVLFYSPTTLITERERYDKLLSKNLFIHFFQFTDSSPLSPQSILSYLIDETNKSSELVFTCDFIYILLISNSKTAIRFSLTCKAEITSLLKSSQEPLPIVLSTEFLKDFQSIRIAHSHDLLITFSYALISKRNRYLCLSSPMTIPKTYRLFNRQVLLENTSEVIQVIEHYYCGKDYRNCALVLMPFIYGSYAFCKVVIDKAAYLNLACVYVDMKMFNCFDCCEEVKAYLKEMALSVLSIEDNRRCLIVVDGIEKICHRELIGKEGEEYQKEINNKAIGYSLSKFLSKMKARANTVVLLLSLGNECINNPHHSLKFIASNADIHRISIGYLTAAQLNCLNDKRYQASSNLIIEDIIAMSALHGDSTTYTPLNAIKSQSKKTTIDFSSICNMDQAKSELTDTIALSLKAKELFQNGKVPIQLSSGVLLIGPSGCGKTLIASAIEKQFNINFYSIKCTDVLSKYIGQSEEIIREHFAKAKSNSPSVMFFDELEALTPVRGSGSSGVTDRIVNQILTYLDGVEAREDVFVIGASANPQLIDPAMLRPGRLDKVILCDYPSKEERTRLIGFFLQQLKCLCTVSPELIQLIADKSVYYTPADFNGLVYNAYLKAVKMSISMNSSVEVNDNALGEAFESFKKAFNKNEIQMYKQHLKSFSQIEEKDIGAQLTLI